jgi:carbon starvation protein
LSADPSGAPSSRRARGFWSAVGWLLVALGGAAAIAVLALTRGEPVNAVWFVVAAVACYALAYRYYGAFIAARVFSLDATRATPAERLNDGRDFVPTNRWVVFGHHFAAIAGPGPLIGPTLAAQFGYLPGTLWILFGVVLGGAVQDFCILCGSLRRDGHSLGQMAKDEIVPFAGSAARWRVLDHGDPDRVLALVVVTRSTTAHGRSPAGGP